MGKGVGAFKPQRNETLTVTSFCSNLGLSDPGVHRNLEVVIRPHLVWVRRCPAHWAGERLGEPDPYGFKIERVATVEHGGQIDYVVGDWAEVRFWPLPRLATPVVAGWRV
eukprot:m.79515 g.79515  ORF g.79515 m.79515 type:complete len:110 (-) comp10809_c0_seq1:794-1123(-)